MLRYEEVFTSRASLFGNGQRHKRPWADHDMLRLGKERFLMSNVLSGQYLNFHGRYQAVVLFLAILEDIFPSHALSKVYLMQHPGNRKHHDVPTSL
jgi:hypothetical protein